MSNKIIKKIEREHKKMQKKEKDDNWYFKTKNKKIIKLKKLISKIQETQQHKLCHIMRNIATNKRNREFVIRPNIPNSEAIIAEINEYVTADYEYY